MLFCPMSIHEWECANEYSKSEDWTCAGLMEVCFSRSNCALNIVIGATCPSAFRISTSLDLLRKCYIVRSFRQLFYMHKISNNCFYNSIERRVWMCNLKILVTLWIGIATARWQWGSLDQHFTVLRNMHD